MDLVSRVNLIQTEESRSKYKVALQQGNKQTKPGVTIVSRVGLRQVEAGEGDVGRRVVLARAHVEQSVGQVHVHLVANVFIRFHFSFDDNHQH